MLNLKRLRYDMRKRNVVCRYKQLTGTTYQSSERDNSRSYTLVLYLISEVLTHSGCLNRINLFEEKDIIQEVVI